MKFNNVTKILVIVTIIALLITSAAAGRGGGGGRGSRGGGGSSGGSSAGGGTPAGGGSGGGILSRGRGTTMPCRSWWYPYCRTFRFCLAGKGCCLHIFAYSLHPVSFSNVMVM
ncbi:hypothetical protein OIU77_018282 [Salix suchowensis]|uniref:Glycine-rich protein n=1 Tax=Salix suchowensis TaxID=1278906 RepID=A0ABQ8ZS90_9ROSI|nr:hypothetical protein OIU77_018282 [Salix suchowensis]